MIHVVQALGDLGPNAAAALPDILRARGYEANLNAAIDSAVLAIQTSKPPSGTATKGMKASFLRDLSNGKMPPLGWRRPRGLPNLPTRPNLLLAKAWITDPDAGRTVRGRRGHEEGDVRRGIRSKAIRGYPCFDARPSNDVGVRLIAAKTLGGLGKDAVPAIDALTKATTDADPDLKVVAANALKRIQPK